MILFKRKKKVLEDSDKKGKTPVKFSRAERLKKKETGETKKKKWPKRVIISVISLIIVVCLGVYGFKIYNSAKKMFEGDGGILNLLTGNTTQPLNGEKDGRVNVMLLGVGDEGHSGSTLADTIMIASYDVRTKSVAMFSVPRDLYVKIPSNGYTKINAAHAYGEEKNKGGGPALMKETLESTFALQIHYYARVDFSGLAELVDALGGVRVDVENSFCDYNYPTERRGDTSKVCFNAGSQVMNGTKALQYSRSRHALGVEGSDFARSKRQQKVLLAIKEKSFSAETAVNPKKVMDIMSALGNHVKTDFAMNNIPRLIELAKGVDTTKVITRNFDNSPQGLLVSDSSPTAGYILSPRTGNFKEIQGVIKNIFAEALARSESAALGVYNGTWTTGLATTVGDDLKKAGYRVVFTGDSQTRNYTKTQIIDMSDGKKSETIKALESRFGVVATKQSNDGAGQDIKIIIGRDYR